MNKITDILKENPGTKFTFWYDKEEGGRLCWSFKDSENEEYKNAILSSVDNIDKGFEFLLMDLKKVILFFVKSKRKKL